jgi:hypothetical protein
MMPMATSRSACPGPPRSSATVTLVIAELSSFVPSATGVEGVYARVGSDGVTLGDSEAGAVAVASG